MKKFSLFVSLLLLQAIIVKAKKGATGEIIVRAKSDGLTAGSIILSTR